MLTQDQRTHFRQQGYVLVPNALGEIGLEKVRSAYEQIRQTTEPDWRQALADGSYRHQGVYGHGPAAHVMLDIDRHDPLFLDMANNPQLIPILEQLVGPDLQITEMIAHVHPAGTEAHIEWHRDWPPWSHPTQVLKAKVSITSTTSKQTWAVSASSPAATNGRAIHRAPTIRGPRQRTTEIAMSSCLQTRPTPAKAWKTCPK